VRALHEVTAGSAREARFPLRGAQTCTWRRSFLTEDSTPVTLPDPRVSAACAHSCTTYSRASRAPTGGVRRAPGPLGCDLWPSARLRARKLSSTPRSCARVRQSMPRTWLHTLRSPMPTARFAARSHTLARTCPPASSGETRCTGITRRARPLQPAGVGRWKRHLRAARLGCDVQEGGGRRHTRGRRRRARVRQRGVRQGARAAAAAVLQVQGRGLLL